MAGMKYISEFAWNENFDICISINDYQGTNCRIQIRYDHCKIENKPLDVTDFGEVVSKT